MNASEFNAACAELHCPPAVMAKLLDATPATLNEWSAGTRKIPHEAAHRLAVFSTQDLEESLLAAGGIPECTWLDQHMPAAPRPIDDLRRVNREIADHMARCPTCQARERFVSALDLPVPKSQSFDARAWRALDGIEKLWAVLLFSGFLVYELVTEWREPKLWLVLAFIVAAWAYFRRD